MQEFVDFLGGQSPYDALDPADLRRLAALIDVEYFSAGATVLAPSAMPLTQLWVVRVGAVEVLDSGRLVDLLGPGDTFGHVSLLTGQPQSLTVRAAQDTLCYRLPDPRTVLERPDLPEFAARGAVDGRSVQPVSRFGRAPLTCTALTPVREVAAMITAARQSCALVTFPDGLGIVTDADFRRRVGSGEVPPDAPIEVLATRPALAVPEHTSVASAFLVMLEHDVHHLVLHDGLQRPVGVVRIVDLASADVRDPLLVRAAVDAATGLPQLAEACALLPLTAVRLFESGVAPLRIGALLATVTDAVLRRLLALDAAESLAACSWLVLGSLARREILPASDVDTALVWADGDLGDDAAPDLGPGLRGAAARVLDSLETLGLARCADGVNADTARFARSVSAWTTATAGWLRDADADGALLLSTMLADSRPVTQRALGRRVTDAVVATPHSPQFRHALLRYTLSARPPTGFVRDFVVEHSGEHRGELNLKRGGLRPVTSLGRWAALVTGDTRGSTPERLRRAVDAGLLSRDEGDTLVGAHEHVYGLLLEREVDAIRSGASPSTYIDPATLDTLTRRHLRESFRAIAQVQARLEQS